ncbi:MAG: hypothetical protein M1358_00880 [Chloroflexi bacterium]|nr:hypothetical protein [Chloroflexota bacterium]
MVAIKQTISDSKRLTWADLTALEPGLITLEREIKAIRVPAGQVFCGNACWYGYGGYRGFKRPLTNLVGWYARKTDRALCSNEAYDLAYKHLYSLLPDCRGCSCF